MKPKLLSWFNRAYDGQLKLWQVFWFGYMLTLFPVVIATNIAKELSVKSPASWVPFIVFVIVWLYYAWLAVSLWRCAPNASHKLFLWLGRGWSLILGIILLSGMLVIFQMRT